MTKALKFQYITTNFATASVVDEYNRPTVDSRGHPGPPSRQALSPYPILGIPRPTDLWLALFHPGRLLMDPDLDLLMVSRRPIEVFVSPSTSPFQTARYGIFQDHTLSIPSKSAAGSCPFSTSVCPDIPALSPGLKPSNTGMYSRTQIFQCCRINSCATPASISILSGMVYTQLIS